MLRKKVGLEAELIVLDKNGDITMPPAAMPVDDFPILAEVRGEPASDMPSVVANFKSDELQIMECLNKGQTFCASTIERLPLRLYRQALKNSTVEKGVNGRVVRNIYGTDISDYSDQIITKGKIQGSNISCGLHVHFSCQDVVERKISERKFTAVNLPLALAGEFETTLRLFKDAGYDEKETIKATSDLLSRPVIEYIVRAMDEKFFERFIPKGTKTTKYRQPGFFELKPYGFEYRSLPFNNEVAAALPEITKFAFKLLDELHSW